MTPTSPAAADVEGRLRIHYERWKGTPHVLGGNSARGMDCSAFVQRVFADAFDLRLPRTTEDQVRLGERISSTELRPGDLVFFRPDKTRHVGIYLGDGEFAHASSSDGVTISELDLAYWKRAYWTSRRVLPASTDAEVLRPDGEPTTVSASQPAVEGGARVGW